MKLLKSILFFLFILCLTAFAIVLGIYFAQKFIYNSNVAVQYDASNQQPTVTTITEAIALQIDQAFQGEAYKSIQEANQKSIDEADSEQRYHAYVQLYKLIFDEYSKQKSQNALAILYRLKDYCKVFTQFKEEDFPNP